MDECKLVSSTGGGKPPRFAKWRIHVTTESKHPVELKFAIGFDHTLDLVEARTPFDYKFDAFQFTALMALSNTAEQIVAELWSDLNGEFQKTGSFGGGSQGKFTHHPQGPTLDSAGSGF